VPAPSGVVVVGASVAGLTTVEALREEGFDGPVTLVGAESRLPYARPPLSKQVLTGTWQPERATLRDRSRLDHLDMRLRLGLPATGLDLTDRAVRLARGALLPFGQLVVATGTAARRLPGTGRRAGIHVLRTLDDAVALRRELTYRPRVVVVGGGVLGCEVAAAARTAGGDVTLVGRSPELRLGSAGTHLSALLAEHLTDHAVRVRTGVAVREVLGDARVTGLRLSDSSVVPADVVVAAVGCRPATGWLAGSGLDIRDGVRCDAHGRAATQAHATEVYAVGDVARWDDPVTGAARRVEHQAAAIDHARAVGRLIATGRTSEPIVPFFWSELLGTRVLVHGRPDDATHLRVVAGDVADRRFVAAAVKNGRTLGLIGWNLPREFRLARARLVSASAQTTNDSPEGDLFP
jgi:NADPH-dependent 2,4-dienoyl-CoA reductase/sulfur reductase-like enzyme